MSERNQQEQGLLQRKTALLEQLRRDRVPGVITTALSRRQGVPVIEVLVRPGFQGQIPNHFDGTAVYVRALSAAIAS